MNDIKDNKGFTLLEVIVSITILGSVMASLPGVFLGFTKYNTQMQLKTEAMSVAQEILEEYREQDISLLANSGSNTKSLTNNGHTFDTEVTFCSDSSLCAGNSRHLTVQIDYKNGKMYEVETVFTQLN